MERQMPGVSNDFPVFTGDGLRYQSSVMQTSATLSAGDSLNVSRVNASPSAPWFCQLLVFAATCILVGIVWDISWHSTIGRDTFWTAAHICIHLGGSLGGLVCGWLVLRATFSSDPVLRRCRRARLGLSRAAWRVGHHLGCPGHADERAVRQLVA